MLLKHKVFGEVEPLESGYFHGQTVLIVKCGSGELRNIFVGDTRWNTPTSAIEAVWGKLRL